jgi:ABC-2 type transport system permease protein
MGSAVYANHVASVGGVEVDLMYHPDHDYNLRVIIGAVEKSLDFINKNLGTYPYGSLRIAEIPYYQETSYSMANAIAISEKECWYADAEVGEIRGYIQFILARDLIRQWLISHKTIARMQGADMLWSALPSALALQVVQEHLGSERVNELMDRFKRKYHKERTLEPNSEPPLLYGDNIEYLEKNKGTMALFRLAESIGFNAFNQKVSDWIAGQHKPLVFRNLYLFLQEDGQLDAALRDLFETVENRGPLT